MRTEAGVHTVEQDAFPTCIKPTPESSCDCHRADLRSWTMHDHDQAAHWYRKAAEQGGKIGLKRLVYSLLLIGIATITGYAQETAGEYVSRSRAVPKATAPRMQVQLLSGWRTDELAKVAPMQACYYIPV
jgi:TPR repeat protein